MTFEEAKRYIADAYMEGYMSLEEATALRDLPGDKMIKECERLGARGDHYANEL
jgi:hypothetical protein